MLFFLRYICVILSPLQWCYSTLLLFYFLYIDVIFPAVHLCNSFSYTQMLFFLLYIDAIFLLFFLLYIDVLFLLYINIIFIDVIFSSIHWRYFFPPIHWYFFSPIHRWFFSHKFLYTLVLIPLFIDVMLPTYLTLLLFFLLYICQDSN